MLLWLIITCEIGFWVLLFVGLFLRYVMKYPTVSKLVLLCVPLLDIVLLLATAVDLHSGAPAEFAHGLAAVYLGFTFVYGKSVISWADKYVSYRFASGQKPPAPPAEGWSYTLYEWKQWFKGVAAGGISAALLVAGIAYINDPAKTVWLREWIYYIFWILVIWLVLWPVWYTVFSKKAA